MKLFKFLLLLALPGAFFSCSKENEIPSFDESLLIGEWQMTDVEYTGSITTSMMGFEASSNYTGSGLDLDMIVEFIDAPKSLVSTGEYSIEMVTTTLGVTETTERYFDEFMQEDVWELNKNKLIVGEGDARQEAVIKTLDESNLVVEWNKETTAEELGIPVTEKSKGLFTFEKIN